MIALGTFWSLLSIFHRLLQPSIFRIYRAHTTNKTCPQIKKTNFTIRSDFYPSFPNPPVIAETLLTNGSLKEISHGENESVFMLFFLILYYPVHLQILWIILSKSLFWKSLNHFYLYVSFISTSFLYCQAFHWSANRWTCPLYICSPE